MMSDRNKHDNPGLVTAYASNTRKQPECQSVNAHGWHPKINHLLDHDYSFMPVRYSENAILFRAMSSGLMASIKQGKFASYSDEKPHSALERKTDVFFLSHELSDANTIARLWESSEDAAILTINSSYFNEHYLGKTAATLAFSEPGFVFRYPFLTEPVDIVNIQNIFINKMTAGKLHRDLTAGEYRRIQTKLEILGEHTVNQRHEVESSIKQILNTGKIQIAEPVMADFMPTKIVK